jgi:integrase
MNPTLADYRVDYLRLRRLLGATLNAPDRLTGNFLGWLAGTGLDTITVDAALRWACLPSTAAPRWRAYRLAVIRAFAAYVHAHDPGSAELIPAGLIPSKVAHAVPYIYTRRQTCDLMDAAFRLDPPVRGLTLATVIGLLAATGMRIGEALALDLADVDLGGQVITVTGKYAKQRLVPIDPSVVTALRGYLHRSRDLVAARDLDTFFVTSVGTRPHPGNLQTAFRTVTKQANLPPRPGARGQRLHDFRHTFATTSLVDAYRADVDVDAQIVVLATYLGHVSPASTYWYLTATPELLTLASQRVEAAYADGGLLR